MKIYKGAAVDGDDETATKESRCAVEMKYSSQEHMFTRDMLFFLLKNVEIRDRLLRRPQVRVPPALSQRD